LAAALLLALVAPGVAGASPTSRHPGEPELLASGLEGASGSTVGPDGALYVTEGVAGKVTRIDPWTGDESVVANCLPKRVAPVGGAIDVAFLDDVAYVLVTLVSAEVGGSDVAGIYRVDGLDECTVVADIGTWSVENPPDAEIFLPPGVQYAFEPYRGGFLVTDGHHNRVLFATLDGAVHEVVQLPNVVPTGLDVRKGKVYLALAGPSPHRPEDGRVVSFRGTSSPHLREVASGASLLVDVERACGSLFGLAQGDFPAGAEPGAPAVPGTGQLRVADDGQFRLVVDDLDRPTSVEIIEGTAFVVTLGGDVWRIPHVCGDHAYDGHHDGDHHDGRDHHHGS
jgi:hypothetical protein